MTATARLHCPACGRLVGAYPGVYRSVPDGEGRSHPYAYLRPHGPRAARCPGSTAPLVMLAGGSPT